MKLFRYISGLVCSVVLTLNLCSCLGSGNDAESITSNYNNAIITAFSLVDNSNVCSSLSGYAFTIDNFGVSDDSIHRLYPDDGIIFNADSLPAGTIPDSVKVSLSYASPENIEFRLYESDGKTLGQYSQFSSDSALYFASYPDCRLTVTSYGGTKKVYHVKVNVHKMNADTIIWRTYNADLWDASQITNQRVDTLNDVIYWFMEDSNNLCNVSTAALREKVRVWQPRTALNVSGDSGLDLSTLYVWHGALYAVGRQEGHLLTSTDGYNWQEANTAYQFTSLLGNQLRTKDVYGHWNSDTLNAIVRIGGEYHFATSADARQWNVAQRVHKNFPIKGFTRPVQTAARSNYGNLTSRIYLVGGTLADGTMTSSTWSCDGWSDTDQGPNWEEFTQDELPAMTGASMIEYTLDPLYPGTFWLLFPGQKADGSVPTNRLYGKDYTTLYYSKDNGVSWHRLSRYYAQYADNSHLGAMAWNSAILDPSTWQIYLCGGARPDGTLVASVWTGVLNSLTFEQAR